MTSAHSATKMDGWMTEQMDATKTCEGRISLGPTASPRRFDCLFLGPFSSVEYRVLYPRNAACILVALSCCFSSSLRAL